MLEEYEKQKRKQVESMKSIANYGMGVVILLLGLVFMFRSYLGAGHTINRMLGKPDDLEKLYGGIALLYGGWRIYRGYKKNYFR